MICKAQNSDFKRLGVYSVGERRIFIHIDCKPLKEKEARDFFQNDYKSTTYRELKTYMYNKAVK